LKAAADATLISCHAILRELLPRYYGCHATLRCCRYAHICCLALPFTLRLPAATPRRRFSPLRRLRYATLRRRLRAADYFTRFFCRQRFDVALPLRRAAAI